MALWKPLMGSRTALDNVEKHAGYAYFCIDDGSFHIDYVDAEGNLQRKQISAAINEDTAIPSTSVVHGDDAVLLSNIIDTYILTIDYSSLLAFDTSEVVIGGTNSDATSSILGTGKLGYMVLG